jgi:hypothetical protein
LSYIRSAKFDTFYILSVGLWATLLAFLIEAVLPVSEFSAVYWLLLVLGVDVAHVYSTLYRTYFSREGLNQYQSLLWKLPLALFVIIFIVAFVSVNLFWTVLAYIAVFHFIKQQAGFARIYTKKHFSLHEWVIYAVTGASVLIWHLDSSKVFKWFTQDDFLKFSLLTKSQKFSLMQGLDILIVVFFGLYLLSFGFDYYKNRNNVNWPAYLLTIATSISWYFGIVVANSDFIFTMTNVLTHGVPYLALVWHTQSKQKTTFASLEIFFFILLLLAFFEEALWDSFIWRDHEMFFESFYFLPQIENKIGVAFVLAFLILPQLTHYVLDGYIWKSKGQVQSWSANESSS